MSSEMTMVTMLTITLGAAIFVAWPLLVGRTRPEEFLGSEPSEPVLQRLLFQRDTVYAAMKELEFDLAMGNLSQEDFQQLHERYKKKAVAILKRIDDAKAGKLRAGSVPEADESFLEEMLPRLDRRVGRSDEPGTDLDLEEEIQSFRKKSRDQNGRTGLPSASRASQSVQSKCPSCGHPVKDPEALFCSKCGAPIRKRSKR